MASNKRKQDDRHLKTLREMVALPHNKQCFDCHQRGPTYVNMTIGSYVCTACSGLLRGLNPPHRVKSISMASFTPDEIEFIKCHGNEFCRKVWLGLYDNRLGAHPDSREEQKVKDFMAQKYERKRWYVAPTDTMKEEAKKMNESSASKTPQTKPLKSLLGENAPKLVINQTRSAPVSNPPAVTAPQAPAQPTQGTPTATPPTQSPSNQSIQSSKSSGSTTMDLLGDLGGSDPFGGSGQTQQPAGFANFGNFPTQQPQTQPATFPATGNPLQPIAPGQSAPVSINGGSTTSTPSFGGDKYAALADIFSSSPSGGSGSGTTTTTSGIVDWNTTGSTGGGSVNWGGGSSSNTGVNWGGSGTTGTTGTVGGGINWNSTGGSGGGEGLNWNTSSSLTATSVSSSTSMFNSPASNPFGGSSGTQVPASQPGMVMGGGMGATPNPFGGGVAQPVSTMGAGFGQFNAPAGGMMAPASQGFGQFSTVQNGSFGTPGTFTSAPQGFGGATQTAASGGFDKMGGGFGAQPMAGGFGGQQQPMAFGGQPTQQGFGAPAGAGWGQQMPAGAAANPFMSAASQQQTAPRGNPTNPFL